MERPCTQGEGAGPCTEEDHSPVKREQGPVRGGRLYSEVQCIMGNGHMGPPIPLLTDMTLNITFPQLR